MADDTPLDRAARTMRFHAEPLSALLRAYKQAALREQFDTLESIEQAIYRSRENEIAKLVEIAKAPLPTGGERSDGM